MSSLIKHISVSLLSVILFLGAFSRFSHGKFVPWWYAFQIYHAPDDGSTVAIITPYVDLLISLVLLFGKQILRVAAAVISLFFFVIGLVMQMSAGKNYMGDVALVVVGIAAVWAASTTSKEAQWPVFSGEFWVVCISGLLLQLVLALY